MNEEYNKLTIDELGKMDEKLRRFFKVLPDLHLSAWELDQYVSDTKDAFLRERVEKHAMQCPDCQIEIEMLKEYRYGTKTLVAPATNPAKLLDSLWEKINDFCASISTSFFAVPALASSVGAWSEEMPIIVEVVKKEDGEEAKVKVNGIWRELGDGRMEMRFLVDGVENLPSLRFEAGAWFLDVPLERGLNGYTGTAILSKEDREKISQSEKVYVNLNKPTDKSNEK